MAQPLPYERDYDFTSFQVRHATTPPPGNKLDREFDQIATTIDEVLLRIKDLQRDDLQLANSLVGYDQLKPELRNGFTTPTVWKTATRYAIGASIYVGPKVYSALVAHTSGVFAADLSAGKWHLLADFTIVAGAVQTAVDAAAAAVVSAEEAAESAFTASTAAMNAQALLDTIDVNDVTTLAAISADITAAVANAADISTVAGVVSDIPAVAGIAADVTTVAGIAADVTAAAANMAAIIAAPDAAQAAAESAQAAADIAATLARVVVGPASSVDGRVVAFDGATGELVKDSGVAVSSVVTLTGTQTMTGKTLTSPTINGLDASATAKGIVELATNAETQTGTDTVRAVTPAGFLAGLRGNIRGTVSQSGGIPTGAIIERGSNANGEYVRFADGTQICTQSFSLSASEAAGSIFRSASPAAWTFPAAFVASPAVKPNAESNTRWATAFSVSATGATVQAYSSASTGTNGPLTATATGRWF